MHRFYSLLFNILQCGRPVTSHIVFNKYSSSKSFIRPYLTTITAVYRTPDIARYYEDFHPISRLWTANEGKFSDDIFQTKGYFIYLNGFYISRGIFVALKDVKVLQVFLKLIKLPLNDPLLTRKYWPWYCRIVRNYYITNIKKIESSNFFIHNPSMRCPNFRKKVWKYKKIQA
jgi:hypothetical protein